MDWHRLLCILTVILLTWTIWRAPTNVSKWRMGFNSAFKGLTSKGMILYSYMQGRKWDGGKGGWVVRPLPSAESKGLQNGQQEDCFKFKKSTAHNFKLLSHINETQQTIVTFLKFIISVRGSHCDYSAWAPPPPSTKKNHTYANVCINTEHSGICRRVDL